MKKNSKTIISKVLIFTLGFITSLSGISHANIYKSKINGYMKDNKINLIEELLIKFVSERELS